MNKVSPEYYGNSKFETIDVIKDICGEKLNVYIDGFEGFCIGNIIKYLSRYPQKNMIEDLRKAKRYIEYLIDYNKELEQPLDEDEIEDSDQEDEDSDQSVWDKFKVELGKINYGILDPDDLNLDDADKCDCDVKDIYDHQSFFDLTDDSPCNRRCDDCFITEWCSIKKFNDKELDEITKSISDSIMRISLLKKCDDLLSKIEGDKDDETL